MGASGRDEVPPCPDQLAAFAAVAAARGGGRRCRGECQGANLYVRASDGQFRQIPWRGLISYPDLGNIVEPAIAW